MGKQELALLKVEPLEDGAVLSVQLSGGKGNILTMAMMAELEQVLDHHAGDEALRLVLLSGSEKVFSFGASVEEHVASRAAEMLSAFHRMIRKVGKYPVPIAALVQGPCLGGSFELVLACHMVFATKRGRFACPEIKLGVFPPVLAAIGAQQLGAAVADRLLITGGDMDAAEAARIGWLTKLLDDDDPSGAVLDWYREHLAGLSASSLRHATRAARICGGFDAAVGEPLDRAERLYVDELMKSHDANEGIEAFIARRKPQWTNA